MRDNHTGDQRFKEMMHDFVSTYAGRFATTEDFKAMIEKHMTRDMDLEGNKKLDWFFNEYVYGTQLPTYKLDYSFETGADGNLIFSFKVTQSKVSENFRMLVPIYLELADGRAYFLGRARLAGNTTVEQKVPLKGLKEKPRRAMINYYDDVLASPSERQKQGAQHLCSISDREVLCGYLLEPPCIPSLVEGRSSPYFFPWKRRPVSELGPLSFFTVTAASF